MATGLRVASVALLALAVTSCLHGFQTTPVRPAATPEKQKAEAVARPKPQPRGVPKSGKYFEDRIEVPVSAAPLTAESIVSLLGNPAPFVLQSVRPSYIVIYCEAASFEDCDNDLLTKIKGDINSLIGKSPGGAKSKGSSFSEFFVPHARALGDLVTVAKGLHFSALQIEAVGSDKLRVSKAADATDADFKNQLALFRRDLDHLEWQIEPESPVARVYYVNSDGAAKALSGKAPGDTQTKPASQASVKDSGNETDAGDQANNPAGGAGAKPPAGAAAKPAAQKAAGVKPAGGKGGKGGGATPPKPTPVAGKPNPQKPPAGGNQAGGQQAGNQGTGDQTATKTDDTSKNSPQSPQTSRRMAQTPTNRQIRRLRTRPASFRSIRIFWYSPTRIQAMTARWRNASGSLRASISHARKSSSTPLAFRCLRPIPRSWRTMSRFFAPESALTTTPSRRRSIARGITSSTA